MYDFTIYNFTIFIKGIVDRPEQSNMDVKPEPKRLQNLQSFQVYLLRYALFNFPNAKRVIYSTCSLHPEENEEVVDEVLADIGDAYRLVPVRQLLKNNWTNFSSKKYDCGDACLYSKPEDDFCNGFFIAIFERNFDVILPKCKHKGGNEYGNLKTNLNVTKDYEAETYKRKKYGEQEKEEEEKKKNMEKGKEKKKKKKKEEISATVDEQKKISTDIIVPEIESQMVKAKRSEKKVEEMDVCSNLSDFNHKLTSNRLKDIQEKISEEMKAKKSRKQASKRENAIQIEINNDMLEADSDEKEQNEKIKTELLKKKKKKKKETKEIVTIDEIYVQKKKQDVETIIIPPKKRKRNKENC